MNNRPVGITVLSVLAFIYGVGLIIFKLLIGILGWQLLELMLGWEYEQILSNINLFTIICIIGVLLLSITIIIGAVGMWLGKKWAWWIGLIYFLVYIFISIKAMIISLCTGLEYMQLMDGSAYYFINGEALYVFCSLIVIYFLKDNVMEFFDISHYSKKKSVLMAAVPAIALFGLVGIAQLVISKLGQ